MSSRNRNMLPNNLAQLQNLVKRDPELYKEELSQQWRHYKSNVEIFKLDPTQASETLSDLVMFISQVASCSESLFQSFPDDLCDLLVQHYPVMDPGVRLAMVKALIMLRNKNLISPLKVLELFFRLLKAKDKLLRKVLYNQIVSDIKNINAKHKNNKVNTSLQNFMFSVLRDGNAVSAKMSLDIMIELYHRNIWHDAKTVNVIVTACFSKVTKVMVTGLKFFLGSDSPSEGEGNNSGSDNEADDAKARQLLTANQVSKKTVKKKRKLEKALAVIKKSKKKSRPVAFNFSAIHLINDPQGFAEKLFKQVECSTERFEVKLMTLNLISRLVGIHELILLNFYPYLQRFLQPHQREVTKLLLYAAQASHQMVPPDAVEPVLLAIANKFVSERNSSEVMAVGLNAIREICNRCPLAMTSDLLQDLVQYKSTKNKAVVMAARSLMQLYRNMDSTLLHRKDRGKPNQDTSKRSAIEFGAMTAPSYVPGAELLFSEENALEGGKDENDSWETDDESGSDDDEEDGWIDISHTDNESTSSSIEHNLDGGDDHDNANSAAATEDKEKDDVKKAEDVSTSRLLSDEDFRKIQKRALSDQVSGSSKRKRKSFQSSGLGSSSRNSELVDLAQIENVHKKARHDKDARLASVRSGREGRESFSKPKAKRLNANASTTNQEKLKKKPFMMIKNSRKARSKGKKSFREKQIALRDALLKREKMGKK